MYEAATTAGSYILANYANTDLYAGFILGLQYDTTNTAHNCYLSAVEMLDSIDDLPAFINNVATDGGSPNSAITAITDNPYYMPGTYFKLAKRGSEIANLYFAMYEQCYLEDLTIAIGTTVNSLSGGFNTATTLVVYVLNNLDISSPDNVLTMLYAHANADDVENFAITLAGVFKSLFNVQVPDATLDY